MRNGKITLISAADTMNNGISGNGVVVGFYFADGVSYLADENGIVTDFTFDGDRFTLAWDINARGDAVGVVGTNQKMTVGNPQNPSGFFRSNAGVYVELKVIGASSTQVIDINNARDLVGQYTVGAVTRGFVHRLRIEKQQWPDLCSARAASTTSVCGRNDVTALVCPGFDRIGGPRSTRGGSASAVSLSSNQSAGW